LTNLKQSDNRLQRKGSGMKNFSKLNGEFTGLADELVRVVLPTASPEMQARFKDGNYKCRWCEGDGSVWVNDSPSGHPNDLLRSVQVYFRGGRIYVPSPGWNLSRDDAICRSYEERLGNGERPGVIDASLAKEFGLSVRRIQQITSEGGLRSSKKSKRKKSQ
jgi:uncharacterized protein YodC (DUF2158 family)